MIIIIKINSNPDVKIFLIGNKSDLKDNRQVTYEQAKKYKEENELLYFEETSAKTGINAKKAFYEAAKILFDEHLKYQKRAHNSDFREDFKDDNNNKAPQKLIKTNNKSNKRNSNCC